MCTKEQEPPPRAARCLALHPTANTDVEFAGLRVLSGDAPTLQVERRLPANLPRERRVGTLAWFVNLVCVNCFSLFELAASYFFLASSHGLLLRCHHVDASGLQ